jgi:hypothetical protein
LNGEGKSLTSAESSVGLTGLILVGVSGGVGGYLDDEVGIEGHADPF